MIKIVIFNDGQAVNEFIQTDNRREISIGRAPGCLIRLDESSISRLHAVIRWEQNNWIIERRANFGVVLVNGQEIENAILQGGEEIRINDFVLRIQLDEKGTQTKTNSGQVNEDGRTKILGNVTSHGIFRFEPGTANLAEFVLQEGQAVFGRANNCDVVLFDKKASRKQLEIRRQGLNFFIKDLQSANGTLLNEKKLTTEVELVPGDVVQIGDSRFEFSIESRDFFAKQQEFLPVPADLIAPAEMADPNLPAEQGDYAGAPDLSQDGTSGESAVPPPVEKSLFKRWWKKYQSLPQTQRYAVIFIVLIVGLALFQEEEKAPVKKKPAVKRDEQGRVVRVFDQLNEEKKEFVRKNYKELVEAQQKREYRKMLDLITKINAVVDEYRDLKAYESIAKRGLEEEEAKERARLLQEKQEALKREVAALEDKGKQIFARALKSVDARPELTSIVQDIYSKDPNNRLAQEWTSAIKDKEIEEAREKEVARQKAMLKSKAEKELAAVEEIFKQQKYREALLASEKLLDIGYSEEEYPKKVDDLQDKIRAALSSIIEPLLKEAEAQRAEGGDLVKANDKYTQILKIDPSNKPAIKGLESIRETLHMKARKLYSLAVLSESISDLADAKDKFSKCFKTAPDEDIYKERCKSKLARYEVYQGVDSGQ